VTDWVLDASALLALLHREPGADQVAAALGQGAVIGAVNLAEVVSRLTDGGMPETRVRSRLDALDLSIATYDEELALRTGFLRPQTRAHGLSLGDRACVALAQRLDATALTADSRWRQLAADVRLAFIR